MLPQQSATKKGRRNVKGFSRKRKTHERNRLTNGFKKCVIAYYVECNDVQLTLKHFWPELINTPKWETKRRAFYKWLKNKEHIGKSKDNGQGVDRDLGLACVLPRQVEPFCLDQLVQRLFSLKVSEDLSKALNNQHVMSDEESGDEEEAHTGEIRDVDEAQEDDQEEEAHTEDDSEDYSEDESE